jgi:hypothetical protein
MTTKYRLPRKVAAAAGGGMLVVTGTAMFAGAEPAQASASGWTGTGNGIQGMSITGNGTYVSWVVENKINYSNSVCDYQAKWYGDYPTDGGWTTFYGPKANVCEIDDVAWESAAFFSNFKAHTGFYGYWYSKGAGDQNGWSNPVKEEIE